MFRSAFLSLALAAAAAAIPSLPDVPRAAPPSRGPETRRQQRRITAEGSAWSSVRRRGPGWTQAHVQRMALKRRNRARNRKAQR